MIRLFVALTPPDSLRDTLTSLDQGLRGARWVPRENLHVTLRFIGEVEEGLAREIDQAFMALRVDPFSLTVSGLGLFGTGHRQRTLWAGVEKTPDLVRLKHKLDRILDELGLEPDRRQYTPHITLARLDDPHPDRLRAYVEAHNLSISQSFPVEAFSLYSSHLRRDGPLYTEEAVYPLGSGS
jgi:2'-5' RNA ligase